MQRNPGYARDGRARDPGEDGSRPSPDRLTKRVVAACQAVGEYIEAWGFRSIHGRVWALLALRTHPMAQAEIAETLGVSRSLVNLAISELGGYGLVRAVGEGRNAPYEACMDIWAPITDVIRAREWMLIERARVALEAAYQEALLSRQTGASVPWDVHRIKLLLAMAEFAQTVLRAVLAIQMPRSLDTLGQWLERSGRGIARVQKRWPF